MKNNRAAFAQSLIVFLVYLFVTLAVHEYGHLIMIRLLGYEGYVSSDWMSAVQWVKVPSNPFHRFLVGMAGGLTVGLVFGFLYFLDVDKENRFAFIVLVGSNLVYCGYEGYGIMTLERAFMRIGSTLSNAYIILMLALYLYLKKFKKDDIPNPLAPQGSRG